MSATVAETVTYSEDSASPLTVSKPASFGVGQMLVLCLIQHNNPSAQTDLVQPSGWSTAGALDGVLDDGKVFYYTYTGSDPATWDFPYKSTADVAAFLFRITGADVAAPTLVVSTTPTTSVTSPMDSPSVTPTGTDDLLLALISDICNGTILAATVPSGMTDLGLAEVTGHFMSSRAAYEQLSSGSATGVQTWTSVSPTGITGGTWTVAIKSASGGGGAGITPGPIVVSAPTRPTATIPILLRSTLQDPPVLTAPQPIVVSVIRPPIAGRAVVLRSTLVDPPVLTTPGPVVVTGPARAAAGFVALLRSSLADVIASTTTPQPIVVAAPARPAPGVVTLLRSSLVDTVTASASAPQPLVVVPTVRPAIVTPPYIARSTLADPPVLTTSQPIVVTSAVKPQPQPPVLLLRSSLIDLATPQPIVVTAPAAPARATVLLLRSSLADAVIATTATPQPLVIAAPQPRAAGRILLLAAPPAGTCDCTTHRPNTGTTSRGSTGTTTRPFTGTTSRPCSC